MSRLLRAHRHSYTGVAGFTKDERGPTAQGVWAYAPRSQLGVRSFVPSGVVTGAPKRIKERTFLSRTYFLKGTKTQILVNLFGSLKVSSSKRGNVHGGVAATGLSGLAPPRLMACHLTPQTVPAYPLPAKNMFRPSRRRRPRRPPLLIALGLGDWRGFARGRQCL